ncbi:MAG: hypothetical protein ACKV2V_13945 [Blastocatellia bacterium]
MLTIADKYTPAGYSDGAHKHKAENHAMICPSGPACHIEEALPEGKPEDRGEDDSGCPAPVTAGTTLENEQNKVNAHKA